jgi:hypothetical protein
LLKGAVAYGPLLAFSRFQPSPAAAVAGRPLELVRSGVPRAVIVAGYNAGPWEKRAADDLAKYIELMTGALLPRRAAPPRGTAAILVGKAALDADPGLALALDRIKKSRPVVRADAILVRRAGERLYVVGSNDESTYFAASWLLQHWGCRWYMPTAFGEHVPRRATLSVGAVDHAYAPPFELRHYWLAWNGDTTGAEEFQRRNFMSSATLPLGHALDSYTAELAPAGGTHFNVPFADPRTAAHVAAKVEADYAAGKPITLTIADGIYANDHPADRALATGYDRAFLRPALTDAMLTLYNNVSRILSAKHPHSRSWIGGMAYSNVTMPPRIVRAVEPNIIMWLAPIDADPNHAMDDPRSPPRREYGETMRSWSRVVDGRLAIYDYDQSMLVWRDLPNPSHHVFAREVKHYRAAGILGFGTESRGALATTFLNLFFRGQLMWNPEADVAGLLAEFYPNFYGPAAAPMQRYWERIFSAWAGTIVTEHEYFIVPAIYTRGLIEALRSDLEQAERLAKRSAIPGTPALEERMRFTRLGFELIDQYSKMLQLAAADCDYAQAVAVGERGLAARQTLARMNPLFTTRVVEPVPETPADGPAWWPGEIEQLRGFAARTDGSRGTLIARLPLLWSFKRAEPLAPSWTYAGPEGAAGTWDRGPATEEVGTGWQQVRSDLYLQAQGVLAADGHSPLGHYWYRSAVTLPADAAQGAARILFPGLFNEAWLFVNGALVAHREYREPWWLTDYKFEWDVDLTGHLRAGENRIALRGFNPHHMAGMFRRPFLYRPSAGQSGS